MNFHMVRDTKTGLYYKRIHGRSGTPWVDQEAASVWTTPEGARACLGAIAQQNRRMARFGPAAIREPEIVTIPVSRPKVAFVDGDDWQGVYIDGKLQEQGHHIRIDELLRLLGIDGEQIYADDDWLAKRGGLPPDLDEVKRG
jgi:hypothetical protein